MIFLLEIIYHNHSKLIWTGEDSKMNSKTLIQYFNTSANTLHTILQNARISYEFHMNMFYYMKRVRYLHEFQLKWITVTVYECTIFKKNFAKIKILIHVISMQSKIHLKISNECNSFYRGSLGQDISGLTVRPAWNVTYFIWKTQLSPFSEPWHTSNAYKYTYPIFLCVVMHITSLDLVHL